MASEKYFWAPKKGTWGIKNEQKKILFYTGLYERETWKAGEVECSPWLSSIQTFPLLQ